MSLKESLKELIIGKSMKVSPIQLQPSKKLIQTFNTKVAGVTYPCAKDKFINRQDVLKGIYSFHPKFHLEPFVFNDKMAYYVIYDKRKLDIGCVKATLAKELSEKYSGCEFRVVFLEITGDDENRRNAGCNISIEVYR
jgi:hypothetical protein